MYLARQGKDQIELEEAEIEKKVAERKKSLSFTQVAIKKNPVIENEVSPEGEKKIEGKREEEVKKLANELAKLFK